MIDYNGVVLKRIKTAIISEHIVDSTSSSAIVGKCGVSSVLIIYHIPTRDAIYKIAISFIFGLYDETTAET